MKITTTRNSPTQDLHTPGNPSGHPNRNRVRTKGPTHTTHPTMPIRLTHLPSTFPQHPEALSLTSTSWTNPLANQKPESLHTCSGTLWPAQHGQVAVALLKPSSTKYQSSTCCTTHGAHTNSEHSAKDSTSMQFWLSPQLKHASSRNSQMPLANATLIS